MRRKEGEEEAIVVLACCTLYGIFRKRMVLARSDAILRSIPISLLVSPPFPPD